jgi:hypothetical protein
MSTARHRKTELFISALLSSRSVEEAAAKTGIALITARRWMQDPEFVEQFRKARQEIMGQATTQIQQATSEAIVALRQVISTGDSEAAKVSSARTILEIAFKAAEIDQLEQRIETLERVAREQAVQHGQI